MKQTLTRQHARKTRRLAWLAALAATLGIAALPCAAADSAATAAASGDASAATGGTTSEKSRRLHDAAELLTTLYPQGIPVNEPTAKSSATYTVVTVATPTPTPAAASASGHKTATNDRTGKQDSAPVSPGAPGAATLRQGPAVTQLTSSSDGKTTLTTAFTPDRLIVTRPPTASAAAAASAATPSSIAAPGLPSASLPAAPGAGAALRPDQVDVNRADAGQLAQKLKIDARRARLIIEFRQAYGPFKEPDDLAQVFGVTDEMLMAWEDRGVLALR